MWATYLRGCSLLFFRALEMMNRLYPITTLLTTLLPKRQTLDILLLTKTDNCGVF